MKLLFEEKTGYYTCTFVVPSVYFWCAFDVLYGTFEVLSGTIRRVKNTQIGI